MSPLLMLWTVFTGAAAWKRRQLTEDCKNAAETGANLLHRVMTRLALSGHTETIYCLSAFGGKADMGRRIAPIVSAAFDPQRSYAG